MRYIKSIVAFGTLLFSVTTFGQQMTIGTTPVDTSTVISGLDIPWEIHYGPDGWLWTTERYGRVSRINPADGTQKVLLDLSTATGSREVYQKNEAGLLGLALHPNFSVTPEVFFVYTYLVGSSIKERLVKYTYQDNQLSSPVVLIESIPGNTTHDGSRLLFLSDNTLLMSTGDAQNQQSAQDTSALSGKVLRLNTDGTIPSDNPFPNSYVYSLGHRNAQGLAVGPNGLVYASEHGPQTDDEFQIIKKAGNYGWPTVHGTCDSPPEISFCNTNTIEEPLAQWTPTIAPGDIAYYTNDAIPEWKNKMLLAVLKDKKLVAIEMNNAGTEVVKQQDYLKGTFNRLRDVAIAPDGTVYLATSGDTWSNTRPFTHRIVKIKPIITGTSDRNKEQLITLFPNPTTRKVTVSGSFTSLKVLNQNGVSVLETANSVFDVSGLSTGVYVVKIVKDDNVITDKIIVE